MTDDERIQTPSRCPSGACRWRPARSPSGSSPRATTLGKGDDVVDIDTDKIAGTLESPWPGRCAGWSPRSATSCRSAALLAVVAPAEVPRQRDRRGRRRGEGGGGVGDAGRAGRAAAAARRDRRPDDLLLHAGRGGAGAVIRSCSCTASAATRTRGCSCSSRSPSSTRCTRSTCPGTARRTRTSATGRWPSLADTVVGFLDALGIDRAHLVGHSLGGAVVRGGGPLRAGAGGVADAARAGRLRPTINAGVPARVRRGRARGASSSRWSGGCSPTRALVTRQLVDDLLRYKRLDGVDKALSALLGTLLDGDRQAIDTPRRCSTGVDVPVTVVWGRRTGSCRRPTASGNGWTPGTCCTWRRRTTSSACCGCTCSEVGSLTNGTLVGLSDESAAPRDQDCSGGGEVGLAVGEQADG